MRSLEEDHQQYAFGYNEKIKQMLSRRTVDNFAQFLKPYLKPNIQVLDCGCGPGTMTVGFAELVAPGKVIGLDMNDEVLSQAKLLAQEKQIENIDFKLGSIFEIPYPDDSFDIVFTQSVLAHLKNPIQAIAEMKRVTKKNGVVAVKEPYCSGFLFYPETSTLKEHIHHRRRTLLDNDADDDIGIKLREMMYQLNLQKISHEMQCMNRGVQEIGEYFAQEVNHFDQFKKLVNAGELTEKRLQEYQEAWMDFSKNPGAYFCLLWGEAIGFKE